jgi:soluble lytic murein transglycosylase-like protein
MMMGRRAALMGGIAFATLVVAGTAQFVLHPRGLPGSSLALRDAVAPGMTQAQLEELLAKVGKGLRPELRAKLAEAVLTESARAGYDPLFVLALVAVESSFRPTVSSDRGAAGLMQLKPSTFAWIAAREPDIGGDDRAVAEDPVVDVRLAVRYFHWLEKRFHNRDDALMAYNAGPRRLREYKRSEEIPGSLREYPRRVLKEYRRFARLVAGGADSSGVLLARAN